MVMQLAKAMLYPCSINLRFTRPKVVVNCSQKKWFVTGDGLSIVMVC